MQKSLGQVGVRRVAGFTLVELIVVLTVIVLLLAVSMPGLSSMHRDMRANAAVQTISGMLTRAYYLSIAESTLTAVRFMPAEWDVESDEEPPKGGLQRVAVYQYVGATYDPATGGVVFNEFFAPVESIPSMELPAGIWAAPVEALDDVTQMRDLVLNGRITQSGEHNFSYNADPNVNPDFLNADDFLIVFDPQSGLRGGQPTLYPIRAYDPQQKFIDYQSSAGEPYQRYGFTGVVLYNREVLVELAGSSPDAEELQDYLQTDGRPYLAHRFSGGLVSGALPQTDD